jgi:hypothetical protein
MAEAIQRKAEATKEEPDIHNLFRGPAAQAEEGQEEPFEDRENGPDIDDLMDQAEDIEPFEDQEADEDYEPEDAYPEEEDEDQDEYARPEEKPLRYSRREFAITPSRSIGLYTLRRLRAERDRMLREAGAI